MRSLTVECMGQDLVVKPVVWHRPRPRVQVLLASPKANGGRHVVGSDNVVMKGDRIEPLLTNR